MPSSLSQAGESSFGNSGGLLSVILLVFAGGAVLLLLLVCIVIRIMRIEIRLCQICNQSDLMPAERIEM